MSIRVACLWCGTRNDVTKARMNNLAIYCRHCGHHADKTQRRCDCHQCLNASEGFAENLAQQGELFEELGEVESGVSVSPET